ncbi:MAG: tRNA 4-thiouridine(8) synthase ThiI [Clostridiales bacterium]|nr:tRNA 4-thiouridine(8) synthase ThiI [Clostridiales bacterium]
MEKVIVLRIGEIFLKGKNKSYFDNMLINNLRKSLTGLDYKFRKSQNRYYLEEFKEEDLDTIVDRVTKVFGLHSLSIATKVQTSEEEIAKYILDYAPNPGQSFRITCTRADKTFPYKSFEFAAKMGGVILSNVKNVTVDLHEPQKVISIDIREQGYTYIFADKIMCAQGMPVGTSGKGMLLLSGGFDSPVAGWRMARRGMKISAIHFHSYPHTSLQAKEKVIDLAKVMTEYCGEIELFIVPFTKIQEEIHKKCKEDFMITIMRRIMIMIAERIAKNNGCGALITGESLAQVASQTVESITSTNQAVELMPVFRPLIGMDKMEIIETAEHIGTAKLSELPYPDCCTVFLPDFPVIKPKLQVAIDEQSKIVNLEELIQDAIDNTEEMKLKPNYVEE